MATDSKGALSSVSRQCGPTVWILMTSALTCGDISSYTVCLWKAGDPPALHILTSAPGPRGTRGTQDGWGRARPQGSCR